GALDLAFGDQSPAAGRIGYTVQDFFGSQNSLTAVQLVSDDNGNVQAILAAGNAKFTVGRTTYGYMVVSRYRPDGSLGFSFGANGAVAIDFGSANNFTVSPGSSNLLIQPDGKVVMATGAGFTSGPYAGYNFALARLWP